MEKDFNNDNSKKIIIGVSIIFCTVVLIIGTTTAYFTQSGVGDTGNIVATDQVTLDYQDNDEFMLGNLIPINENDLETAYNNKCKDNLGYNVCSIYQFTITNTGNVVQDIIINMHPKVNGFTNLKFNLYDITNNEQIIFNQGLKLNSEEPINLENDLTLDTTNNKSNIYELVFYIKNDPDHDQSHLDAGVRFGANIEVNSVTTGFNVIKDLGDPGCWKPSTDNPTILSEFVGFDENGEVKKECETYYKEDNGYYIVNVPSNYGGYNFTSLGTGLFFPMIGANEETGEPIFNKHAWIKEVNISEGIERIEDGYFVEGQPPSSVFMYAGFNGMSDPNYSFKVSLPQTLTHIGDWSFVGAAINSLTIPKNVETIGESAFFDNTSSSPLKLVFEGVEDETSKLKTIKGNAFDGANIISDETNPLIIPYSVTSIGEFAFRGNSNLTKLTFAGSPTLRIEEGNDKNLLTIGNNAFEGGNLTYDGSNEDNYLILPARVDSIGNNTFWGYTVGSDNSNLKFIRYMGSREKLDTFGTSWYSPGVTVKAYGE